jgi:shikimate kinase
MKGIILYGHQACGKTYFGQLLAQDLGCPFIDTDREIEAQFQESCRRIAKKRGEPFFRKVEAEMVQSLRIWERTVISVGGGSLFNELSYLKLKTCGILIYLELEKALIKQRLFKGGIPSYLDPHDPEASFEKMYEERQEIYEKLSPYKVHLSGKTDSQILGELKNYIDLQ